MNNKESCFVSAVVYVHNAESRISGYLKMLIKVLSQNFDNSEIICVNDASDDGSVDVIRKISSETEDSCITIVNTGCFHGLELAMNAGVDLAIGDFVFEFDNTVMDYDESMIMKIYQHALTGFDIVSASPDRKAKLSSRVFYSLFEQNATVSYKLSTETFRILSRRAINRIDSMNKTIPYRKAAYIASGMKLDTLKYDVKPAGPQTKNRRESNYRFGLAVDTLILFTEVGYRFSFFMTSMMIIISLTMIIYTLLVFFLGNPIEGWTTTLLFLSVAFFGLFGILTIIIKYLQIIVDMVFKRKHYIIESIEKLTK